MWDFMVRNWLGLLILLALLAGMGVLFRFYARKMIDVMKRVYLGAILVFLYAPILVLVVFSFNATKTRGLWGGFSTRWYEALFQDRQIMQALYNTVLIAVIAAVVATVIGTAAAFGIHAMKSRAKKVVLSITNLPVMNPDIVTGISLMILFTFFFGILQKFGIKANLGFTTLLLAHITFNIPYVILSVLPKIRQLDANIFEAAQDLGATPFYAFTKVILPEVMPGIVTGAIFAFTLSLDDFVISFFTTGAGVDNLSILIFSEARKGIKPTMNALSTIMFAVVMLLLFFINRRDSESLGTNA